MAELSPRYGLQGKDSFHISSPSQLAHVNSDHNPQQLFTIHTKVMFTAFYISTFSNCTDYIKQIHTCVLLYHLLIIVDVRKTETTSSTMFKAFYIKFDGTNKKRLELKYMRFNCQQH